MEQLLACGPLLGVLPDETASVVHHSLTEFLNGSTRDTNSHDYPTLEFGSAHNRLALVCLSYLQSACVDELVVIQISLGRRVRYYQLVYKGPVFCSLILTALTSLSVVADDYSRL
jgi:hypothetical protein